MLADCVNKLYIQMKYFKRQNVIFIGLIIKKINNRNSTYNSDTEQRHGQEQKIYNWLKMKWNTLIAL